MSRQQRVISALAGLLVATVSAVAGWPASAAASTSAFFYVSLAADMNVPVTLTAPYEETVLVRQDLVLAAGESRRLTSQIELTLSSSEGAQVGDILVCFFFDPNTGWQQVGDRSTSGTNHPGSDGGSVLLSDSLLLKASVAGTYRCETRTYTSDGGRTGFYLTALKSGRPINTSGTWMRVSAADEVGSYEWRGPFCDASGTLPGCVYLGGSGDPAWTYVFDNGGPRQLWTATNDATTVDIAGTFQVTSCPHGSASCTSQHWGDDGIFGKTDSALVFSVAELNQLYPDGSPCRVNQSSDPVTGNYYRITNAVHHFPIMYRLTAPVMQNCHGSRTFALRVLVWQLNGNPVKIDGGAINVINSVRASSTATVPNVIGSSQAQASTTLQAAGFTVSVEGSIIYPAPPGTVIFQNSPGGTVEPAGSRVYITLSLGQATVPDVRGSTETRARQSITGAGLTVGSIGRPDNCVDPGFVSDQSPAPGTRVVPGSAVQLTVPTCSSGVPK